MKLKALLLGLLLLLAATSAPAALITLTQSQLLDSTHWVGVDNYGFNDTRGTNWAATAPGALPPMPNFNSASGVFFTSFHGGAIALSTLTFTGSGSGLSLAGQSGEGIGLDITNWNNQSWNFQVQAIVDGTTYQSSIVPIASSYTQGFQGDTNAVVAYFGSTLTLDNDDILRLIVSNSTGGDAPHFEVNPVPEPGTMMLLGSGLVGLAGWGRKKFRR